MSHRLRLFILEYNFSMSAYWICTGFLIAKLTQYYNLPLGLSNLLTGLSSTFLVLQPVGGLFYARLNHKHRFLVGMNVLWRVSICLVFFTVLLPMSSGAAIFCILLFVMQGIQQLSAPAYENWQVELAEAEHCTSYYTARETLFMLIYTVANAAVQITISVSERMGNLQAGFFLAGIAEAVLLLISLAILPLLSAPVAGRSQGGSLTTLLQVLKNKDHTKVIMANASWCFANVFVGGLFGVYAVRVLNIDFITLMIWGTAGNILRGAFAPVFSRIASRIGWKTCLSNIFVLYALLALLLFFSGPQNGFWIAPIYLVLSTLPMSGISVGTLQLRVATSDAEMRSVYFSAYSLISGAASLVGTSICSALIEVLDKNTAGLPLQSLYLLGLLLLVFPFVLFRNLPKDVR